jgi:AraC-like DNA-binding protein
VLPDGCLELAFLLGDDIKRYVSDAEFVLQPRAMVIGPMSQSFVIEPCGEVHAFAVRFYPYGFCSFVSLPLSQLANRELPLGELFSPEELDGLETNIVSAPRDEDRIRLVEGFLSRLLTRKPTIDRITKGTVDAILKTRGRTSIGTLLDGADLQVRQLERNFQKYVGLSPKKLGRAVRFQSALAILLDQSRGELSRVAYDAGYFDQAHFIHDFKQFTGVTPGKLESSQELLLSSLFSQNDS